MDKNAICTRLEEIAAGSESLEEMLLGAVELLHESEPRFHWTGIYELFPDATLRLGPFLGAATDHVFIGVGQGVCGSAVAEGRNKNIPDVSKEANYLACSTSTKSELVVLIRSRGEIFAQIDIDSHEIDAFDDETVERVQLVANWLASAYDSLRFEASQAEPAMDGVAI